MSGEPIKEDGVTVSGPGGWKATAQGRDTIIVLLIGVIVALGYLHHQSADQHLQDMAAQHQKIDDKFNEMIYVLSLTQPDREKLNIAMPESLRAKIRRQRRLDD
jgi:hypothetical protein